MNLNLTARTTEEGRDRRALLARGLFSLVAALFLVGGRPDVSRAQKEMVVHVRVTDSARAPLGGVEVTVVSDSARLVRFGHTDDAGQYTFSIAPENQHYRIAARHIGYVAVSRMLAVSGADTMAVELSLRAIATRLDTVRIAERPLPLAKQPFIGANEIASDTRSVLLLRDVVLKMRPDIDYQAYKCARMVIGSVYPGPIPRSHIVRMSRMPDPPRARVYVNGDWIPSEYDPWNGIYAEHIAQVMYVGCRDASIPGLPPSAFASVYVVLKNGFGWDYKSRSTQGPP